MPEVEKAEEVFSKIPYIYDKMNTLMSMGMDIFWRIKLLSLVRSAEVILDVGTGTGKLESLSSYHANFVGIDVTREMISLNGNRGHLLLASATELPFKRDTFDAVISAFVLRNLPSTEKYFSEAFKVLKSGGIMANLDAFPEERKGISDLFSLYFYRFMPWVMGKTRYSESYRYLARSVREFKTTDTIVTEMEKVGFSDISVKKFVSPSAAIIYGRKI
ncbi:MAG: class I SAM-dependent methyltransferase [Thermoplasmatales archaeon]